jgi:bifunctional UDP-N-acetylglucosamine pyrophosphorylase / glucosamine-1-phosphate N-acetyltransferase
MEAVLNEQKPIDVLILAAGLGTRMRSDLAKVLHRLSGRTLIDHVSRSAAALAPNKIYVVIGHQGDDVKASVLDVLDPGQVEFVWQREQLGTGDAVNAAREHLSERDSTLLVLSGDVPMIRHETLASLIRHHNAQGEGGAACTILSVKMKEPGSYGRIVRVKDGSFEKIVEQKDATAEEREITEINAGIYCFDTKKLYAALSHVKNNNAQGEYYLTDVPELLQNAGEIVSIYQHGEAREIEGVNDREQLADLERLINRKTVSRHLHEAGVSFIDQKTVFITDSVKIGRDTVIYPGVCLEGDTEIGERCVIRSGTRISNSRVGSGVEILDNSLITDSEIGDGCKVGPMAHLRGNAVMMEGSKVGNFVELKKTKLGAGSKASHLTYLGDATIGENSNIGAGTITCNFDGKNKHETRIGDNVKIGSDTMLVAPVTVGDGAVTGAGSVVTKDVEENTLVVGVPARPRGSTKSDPSKED